MAITSCPRKRASSKRLKFLDSRLRGNDETTNKNATARVAFVFGGGGGNRTRVRKSFTGRPTYLAWSFGSRLAPAGRQADAQPVASTDAHGQATRPCTAADVNDAALLLGSLAHQQTSAASSRY